MQLPYGNAERWKQVLTENDQPGRTDFVLVAERDGRMLGNAGLHPVGRRFGGVTWRRWAFRWRPKRKGRVWAVP